MTVLIYDSISTVIKKDWIKKPGTIRCDWPLIVSELELADSKHPFLKCTTNKTIKLIKMYIFYSRLSYHEEKKSF